MRKLSIILAVAFMATISFYSCGNKSLKGTSWKTEVQYLFEDVEIYSIFNFTTDSECKYVSYWDGEEDDILIGTYTYNHPNVTIDLGFDATYTGTVNGKKMTLLHEDDVTIILTKQ